MALVSMETTPDFEDTEMGLDDQLAQQYGSGLTLCINPQQCAALGITSLPEPGTPFTLQARAVVTRTSEVNDGDADDPERNMTLQITDLELTGAPKSASDIASALYGGQGGINTPRSGA